MSILKLTAPCKDYIWGGNRLREEYGKKLDSDKIAESWELSCHKDGQSVIEGGEFGGKTLSEFVEVKCKAAALGTNCDRFEYFPILIKLIDAKDNLSVQVHPSNEYALNVEGEYGKTEMWYIVDCEEGAELLYGFKREISREEFAERIANNTLLEVANNVPVHKGDVFFIESGTLHAIGKGILIAEIQQNSNTTYRVYDYGRVGKDGKPRELHIEKALDVTERVPPKYPTTAQGAPEKVGGGVKTLLRSCEYFTVYKLELDGSDRYDTKGASFHSLLVLDGEVEIAADGGEKVTAKKGGSIFVSADTGAYTISGKGEVIFTEIGGN
ncbi:MAG: class I mannose-6-phosphate isomerase [Oscillospiraceae bacterium]|nr:class I mannose-6-phosphate isomerase [Oscillospiraceae bacterium]